MIASTLIGNALLRKEEKEIEGYSVSYSGKIATIKKDNENCIVDVEAKTYHTTSNKFNMIIDFLNDMKFEKKQPSNTCINIQKR